MIVRIYQPAKTAMQSGRGKAKGWVLEPDLASRRSPEPLMGWVSSRDTLNQVRLQFDTKDDAIAYAKRKGLQYVVNENHGLKRKPKAYADNFRADRLGRWTH
ncbi:MAG: ETC complex I subunit [Alphaproteobacteria bacterium]|nr:ETC complex I subunit [Alphaproteobacteria bacterium]